METTNNTNQKKKSTAFKVSLLALLLLLIALAVCIILIVRSSGQASSGGLVLDTNASEITDGLSLDNAAQGGISIPGYDSITFPADETHVHLTLMNPKNNTCGFIYELYIDDEEEPIYTSGLIEPGMQLTEIDLKEALAAGEYTMYIKVNAFSQADETPLNGALVTVPTIVC